MEVIINNRAGLVLPLWERECECMWEQRNVGRKWLEKLNHEQRVAQQ